MGYSTKFKGQFDLSERLPREQEDRLLNLEDQDTRELKDGVTYPGMFCQWVLSKDRLHIYWDRNEKFYNYVEWLQWIIDELCTPAGVQLSGRVEFQGDDVDDHGFLAVQEGKVVRTKCPLVADDYEELKRFRDFVLQSEYKDDITSLWKRQR